MRKIVGTAAITALLLWITSTLMAQINRTTMESNYLNNAYPLLRKPYMELPLGAVKPEGWLLEMMRRQQKGSTAVLDQLYPEVMGNRNGWLGGDGDQWERGPYWIDGLLPLAYILEDDALKKKVQPWIEWAIASQREDGFFGPATNYGPEPGLQRDNSEDWWPRMVVLKIMQQYYSATADQRVIGFLLRYFRYQLATLPEKPLGHWTFWAEYRACDNLSVVYWLYNLTREPFLLELGELLHRQSHNYVEMFLHRRELTSVNTIHCVNLAQGIKEPVVYYQQDPDPLYLEAVKQAFADIRQFHGQPQGMYGGDEALHGNNPTQGSELCSAVELMYSLEKMLEITGDISFADHLERVAFNALPTQIAEDFMSRQYFQQPNQVMITRHVRNFDINHGETDLVYGLLTGYPCCTSNMHQAWPKFTANLWMATADNGVAALVYAPSRVKAKVADGVEIEFTETTAYPMEECIRFDLDIKDRKRKKVFFPFHLRIPGWCEGGEITINGEVYKKGVLPGIEVIRREWQAGDRVHLTLPMAVTTSRWHEEGMAVERGPLVYALQIDEKWQRKEVMDDPAKFGTHFFEVLPRSKWNYGLLNHSEENRQPEFRVIENKEKLEESYFWNAAHAPVKIIAKARTVPSWKIYNEMAGPLPYSNVKYGMGSGKEDEEITLIPYGCTTLRVSVFPLIDTRFD